MDLADLHIFRSVVHAGGVTRAAEKLNRVQSNVTTRVRQLETELRNKLKLPGLEEFAARSPQESLFD